MCLEILLSDELRLLYALVLNVAALALSWRFCRRMIGGDWVQTLTDALLLFFLIQYASVGLPGLLRILTPVSIAVTALAASAGLWWAASRSAAVDHPAAVVPDPHRWLPFACLCFVLAYLAIEIEMSRNMPALSIDALVYHYSAAVQWLQQGRIGIFDVWYQPANAYSPLGGSVFIAWLMAPLGNDVLARYVQMPPLVLLFLAMMQLARALGLRSAPAALLATAVVLSRPFISHTTLPKDDLFVSAFFAAAVAALPPARMSDRLGPWRIGVAAGLLLATKFTVLFSVPILLLAVDAPWRGRWNWRRWGIAFALVFALAGPWYLRNWLMVGNPLFPTELKAGGITLLPGLFEMQRSADLATWAGVRHALVGGYHSPQPWLAVVLLIGWACAMGIAGQRLVSSPVVRLCLVGPIVGLALFLLRAMYPEVRFLYPSLLLLFACWAIFLDGLTAWGRRRWGEAASLRLAVSLAAALALAATAGGYVPEILIPILWRSTLIMAVVLGLALLQQFVLHLRPVTLLRIGAGSALALAMYLYVHWSAYVRGAYPSTIADTWVQQYAAASAWEYIRQNAPENATIAYANTNLTYPLQGYDQGRRVLYVPTRRDVPDFAHLPHFGGPLRGEEAIARVSALLQADPDPQAWLARLKAAGVDYLFVAKGSAGMIENPVELPLAEQDREHFVRVYADEAAHIYAIR